MTNTCKVCGVTSDTAEFYSGLNSRCKECHKEAVRKNRRDNVEYYRQYDAKRFKEDYQVRERHRRYQKTPQGRAAMKKARQKWQQKNPEKRAAHVLLNNAVKNGRMQKPSTCSECSKKTKIHGHHEDYAKPLDVEWLCADCHATRHNTKGQGHEV